MEFVWAALVLGLAGSLHCIGMCGPLVTAVHAAHGKTDWWYKKALYHFGRISVYALLGLITGSVGQAFVALGFQQWVAIGAGVFMMLFLAWPAGMNGLKRGPFKWVAWLKSRFASLIQKKNAGTQLTLGALNGLLPCGLVYVALAASMALTDAWKGAAFMALFGLGTIPSLLAAGSLLQWLGQRLRVRSYRVVQVLLVMVSFVVILRGANLGIPYLSPKFDQANKKVDCCHKPY